MVFAFGPTTVAFGLLLQALTRQRYNDALVRAVFRGLPDPIAFRTNNQWLLSPAFLSRFKQVRGEPTPDLLATLMQLEPGGDPIECQIPSATGVMYAEARRLSVQNPNGPTLGDLFHLRDLTRAHTAETRAKFIATHDPNTQLPNLSALVELLTPYQPGALLGIDLRTLRDINAQMGRADGPHTWRRPATRHRHPPPHRRRAARLPRAHIGWGVCALVRRR